MVDRIRAWLSILALALAAACTAPTGGPESRPAVDMARGGDLYRSYCIACHTAQVHWRDRRIVQSWEDLRYQVARWQKIAGQNWSREEIDDVAAYLNRLFYEVRCPLPGCDGQVGGLSDKARGT
jgi:mono/diheme cytochrome c family protein